jgi:hypothetical protein
LIFREILFNTECWNTLSSSSPSTPLPLFSIFGGLRKDF